MLDIKIIQTKTIAFLKSVLSDEIFTNFVEEIEFVNFSNKNNYLTLFASNELSIVTFNNFILPLLNNFYNEEFSFPIYVDIKVDTNKDEKNNEENNSFFSSSFSYSDSDLLLDFSFDNFVTGNNQIIVDVAKQLSRSLSSSFSPLFIYGNSGLGKTHLLYSIGNEITAKFKNKRVKYVTGDKFFNDLVYYMQSNSFKSINDYKNYFKNIDVLLLDDIQTFIGKNKTQEEFFHILSDLIRQNKIVVMVSDRSPEELKDFPQRIITRINSGMCLEVKEPDFESRVAILRNKSKIEDLDLPNDVIEYLANTFVNNVRELEGALKQLFAFSVIKNQDIDLNFTLKSLKTKVKKYNNEKQNELKILKAVGHVMKIDYHDIKNTKMRKGNIPLARQLAVYLIKNTINDSYAKIAVSFGYKDHTSTKHAYDKITKRINSENEVKNLYLEILEQIKK